jgi:hypothetical protein
LDYYLYFNFSDFPVLFQLIWKFCNSCHTRTISAWFLLLYVILKAN